MSPAAGALLNALLGFAWQGLQIALVLGGGLVVARIVAEFSGRIKK